MKIFLASLLIVLTGCATAKPQPASPAETLEHDTADVILITLNDEPSVFIFVSKTGQVLATTAQTCALEPKCAGLAERLAHAGKANVIPLHSERAEPKGTQTALPKSASWDQENLKRDDHGCPTAIYIAPNGELHQC